MRTLIPFFVAFLLLAPLTGQAAFTSYGSACNSSKAFQVTGQPKLGTSFTVQGVKSGLAACTRRLCPGPCQRCNSCIGTHGYLVLGLQKISAPITPACQLLNTAEFRVPGTPTGDLTYKVPNDVTLIGQKFYMQRADVTVAQWMGNNCSTHLRPDSIVGMSDGIEATIGI